MVKVSFKNSSGDEIVVDVHPGTNLMKAAVTNGVEAIEAECGSALACATCHVHIPPEWQSVTGEASEDERVMLECGIGVDEQSRLACQITVTEEMDGMVVLTPDTQR